MGNALSKNLKKYFEELRGNEPRIHSEASAIRFLINEMDATTEDNLNITERAVKKWLDGETYPEISKLIILSEILGISIDELLKDSNATVKLKNSLPSWYSSLNFKSLSILRSALNIFLTGAMSKKRLKEYYNWEYGKQLYTSKKVSPGLKAEGISQNTIQQGIELFSGLIADFYFEIDSQDDKINIHTDKFFTADEFIQIEIEKHRKRQQTKLMTNFISEHKDLSPAVLAEELTKVGDIGYRESKEPFDLPYFYGKENIIYEGTEETVRYTPDDNDNETDHWNEIPYFVHKETDLSYAYKSRIGKTLTQKQCEKILQDCENQFESIKLEYFHQLCECNIINFIFKEFNMIEFFDTELYADEERSVSNYYLNVRVKFNLTEKEIRQILSHVFQERIGDNISKLNRAIKNEEQYAKNLVEFFEDYVGNEELGFRNVFKDSDYKDNNDE